MAENKHLRQAGRLAQAAVEMDQLGNLQEAADLYAKAAEQLMAVLQDPATPASQHTNLKRSLASYISRCEVLRAKIDHSLAALPSPPDTDPSRTAAFTEIAHYPGAASRAGSTPTSTALAPARPPPPDPSLVQVGVMGLRKANQEGGKYVLAAAVKAAELNERHDITGKVKGAVVATANAAVAADEKYKIRENVASAARSAYHSAREANEKHEITTKLGNIAKATYVKTREINEEYGITDRIGQTLVAGLNYVSGKADAVLAESEQGQGQQQGQARPALEAAPPAASASARTSTATVR